MSFVTRIETQSTANLPPLSRHSTFFIITGRETLFWYDSPVASAILNPGAQIN
ncbi:hypothetical protein SAMD00023353_0800620 [Rosellinia necatrix]|uniref:Uncharacterized protein n=1 Tax=Rosellinia necatrix TaxID=77044 RepID=A0A1S8A6I5_ROSNE|nr:hypothetical protein SAMD00023353_0800620 [Rosellinia necatrix]